MCHNYEGGEILGILSTQFRFPILFCDEGEVQQLEIGFEREFVTFNRIRMPERDRIIYETLCRFANMRTTTPIFKI